MIDDRTTETTETSTGKVGGGQAAKPAEFVEALAKGLAILESFDAASPEMTLSEIARKVGYSPAAARRSLITLMALGYVGQTNKRFHLRPKIMTLSSGFYYSAPDRRGASTASA
jgi:IclR family pca regulon transcriptional regulator